MTDPTTTMATGTNGATDPADASPAHGFAQYVADELTGVRLVDKTLIGFDAVISPEELDLVVVTTTLRNFNGPDRVEHWRLWVTSAPGGDSGELEATPATSTPPVLPEGADVDPVTGGEVA